MVAIAHLAVSTEPRDAMTVKACDAVGEIHLPLMK